MTAKTTFLTLKQKLRSMEPKFVTNNQYKFKMGNLKYCNDL